MDTLFPISCLSCGKENVWLCDDCLEKIPRQPFQVCPNCEKIATRKGTLCQNCRGKIPLKGLLVAAKYHEQNLAKLIHFFKYKFIEDLHIPLGKILIASFLENNLPIPDAIIPVPLHGRRLRWRGFNQSELLAYYIGMNLIPGLEIPVLNALKRKKYTSPQMKIKKFKARKENIRDVFGIEEKETIKNKRILLLDDISTTGSTMNECAKVLKENGAKEIFGIVLARQEF